ncbi:MAG: cytochrome C [Rhodobacterales bacterium]|nr:MAG: cytochrome C [Rhodobacterales bacterium]
MIRHFSASLALLLALPISALAQEAVAPDIPASGSTADHTKFEILQKDFASGPEVTEACLTCHTEADNQVKHTTHWNWEYSHPTTEQLLGKRFVINSFCGNVPSNEPRCTSCHVGYGWDDMREDPPMADAAVDCLVCHDRSGQYTKYSNRAGAVPLDPVPDGAKTITGAAAWPVDLSEAAQSVGMPGRDNCGNCHFYGGGGDNVKHGDLSSALYEPSFEVDVHMSAVEDGGEGFVCATCHVSDQHAIAGSRYNTTPEDHPDMKPGERRDVATCQSCHGEEPHPTTLMGLKLNDHTDRLACQTCHIPEFARGGVATKTVWDWSTAGQLRDGKPYHEEDFIQSDGQHLHTYMSQKGDFEWGEDVVPFYSWFDGQVRYTDTNTKIDPNGVVSVNAVGGDPADPHARIWPFKRMIGRQAYDSQLNEMVMTNVYGPTTDTALWTNFDWAKAIQAGMDYIGEEYSGEFGFVDTEMFWPTTHMVAPAEQALDCESCHARDGRLNGLTGIYMPGATLPPAAKIGLLLVLAALAGVLIHAALRIFGPKGNSHD